MEHTDTEIHCPNMIQIAKDIVAATIRPFPHAFRWDVNSDWDHSEMNFSAVVKCQDDEAFIINGDQKGIQGFAASTKTRYMVDREMEGMHPSSKEAIYGEGEVPFKHHGAYSTGEQAVSQTRPPKRSEVEGRIRAAFADGGFEVTPHFIPGEGFQIDI